MNLSATHRYIVRFIAVLSATTGCAVLAGWQLNISQLKTVFPGFASMKVNTALCFVLMGILLWLYLPANNRKNALRHICLCLVLFLSGATLLQDWFHFNLGIDEVFFRDDVQMAGLLSQPGRMATTTALSFLFLGISFLFGNGQNNRVQILMQFVLHVVTVLALVAIAGYVWEVPRLYTLPNFRAMALHTSVLLLLVSIAASLLHPSRGITGLLTGQQVGSRVARMTLPYIAVLIVILTFFRFKVHTLKIISEEFAIVLFALSFLLVSILIIGLSAVQLNKLDKKRQGAEEALKLLNHKLETEVADRTQGIKLISNRLLLATKGGNIGIWDWDIKNDHLVWDEQMYRLYGRTKPDFIEAYRIWEQSLHPEDAVLCQQETQQVIAGKKELDIQFRVVWPGGEIRHLKGNARVQRNQRGEAVRMVGTNWDITLEKEREALLIQSEERYHSMLSGIQDYAVLRLNENGVVETWNAGAEKIIGFSENEILGKNFETFFCRQDLAAGLHSTLLKQAAANGKADHEGWWHKKNGSLFWGKMVLSALYDGSDRLTGFTKITQDLTEQKKLELLNQEKEETIRLFVKHTPAAIAMLDTEMRYIMASDQWYTDYAIQDQEIIGKSHYDVFPEIKKMDHWLQVHQRCLKGSIEKNNEDKFVKDDGTVIYNHWEIHPWRRHNGDIGGIIMFTASITQAVKTREKLKTVNEQLKASNAELEQFAYVTSHDLQEPLRMVSSFLQLLEKKYKPQLDETASQYIGFAVGGAERMKSLISDLLSYSRVGTTKDEMGPVSTAKVVEETQKLLLSSGSNITFKVLSPLPEIQGNEVHLKQLFQNLLSNAVKYTKAAQPLVHTGCTDANTHWHFWVQDNGIGINPKYFQKVFEVFQRLHTRTEYSGTGIGLSICKKIVEKHGGRIWIESQEGQGSTFHFTISKHL